MTYKTTSNLIETLKKEGLWAKNELGQNFLVDQNILKKIVDAADLKPDDNVIEVGPGLGFLTQELTARAGHVRSIEIDPEIFSYLERTLGQTQNLTLEKGNVLKAELPNHPYKVVANIPYYITSPILRQFLNAKKQNQPCLIILLVQKEVAKKICAGEDEQSIISLQVQVFGKPKIISLVSRNSFFPVPKVDSAILKITVFSEPLLKNTQLFFIIAKRMFSQKRKTLRNILQNQLNLSREKTENLLNSCNIEANRRPQTLTFPEWEKIIRFFEQMALKNKK